MKKLVIAGSTKLKERALYWRGYFEGRGYEVIDWPAPVSDEAETLDEPQTAPGLSLGRWLKKDEPDYASRLIKVHKRFYKNIDQTDTFFLMNEDRDGVEGYIGASSFAELSYAVISNLNRGKNIEIFILKAPSKDQNCYEEVKFWLDEKYISLYRRPTGKKATIPIPDDDPAPIIDSETEAALEEAFRAPDEAEDSSVSAPATTATPAATEPSEKRRSRLFGNPDKTLDILTCKKSCLASLTPEEREYLSILSPEFPAWLLKYLAAPEMQRLSKIGNHCGIIYSNLFPFNTDYSTFAHSLGVALIVWHFTGDKKQTLAALFHDIATPSFKHTIDFLHGDYETQESTESKTEQIIRDSRTICRQLKKDGILVSEVSNYHLYPIADNDSPNLAADRLEYTFSGGFFVFETWSIDDIRTFYNDLSIEQNENNVDELTFNTPEIAADFTTRNLTFATNFHSDKERLVMGFLADILHSMIVAGYLSEDDFYTMSEREIIDWILSCGDKTIADAFRNFQRASTFYAGATAKKNSYCISIKAKVRYINPLVLSQDDSSDDVSTIRIADLDKSVKTAIDNYLAEKQSKYIGFDFQFTPYDE